MSLQGLVISCCLICAVLFCSAAWDYMLQYWVALAPTILPPIEPEDPGLHAEVRSNHIYFLGNSNSMLRADWLMCMW